MSTQALLVLTTCESTERADALADKLVGDRLAACVNAVPRISSTYLWKGKLHRDEEVLLLIKTTEAGFHAVEQAVKTLSTYELPEIVAVPIHAGSAEYLAWLNASLAD